MRNRLTIPILLLVLILAVGWGFSQYQARRQWELSTENQYRRAFADLTENVNNMETDMSKALVAGSFPQSVRLLTNIWREANSSQTQMGQLPLASVDLSRTKMLLAKVGTFSFNAAQSRLLKGTPANETEWRKLKALRDQTRIVSQHLRSLQQQFYSTPSRWLEVDRLGTLRTSSPKLTASLNNNKVTKAFLMLEDGLRRVPDIQFEGNNLGFVPKPTGLTGKDITAAEALTVARKFLGPGYRGAVITNERIIRGGFPSYMVYVRSRRTPAQDRRLSISVKGGHVAWMLGNRSVDHPRLDYDQAGARAQAFLKRNGFSDMQKVTQESFANIATFSFVPFRNKVLYYPELIKVQVAQDNGEILGFEAVPYLTFNNPNEPKNTRPRFTENRIRQILNPHFKPKKMQIAQVLDEMFNKVLVYEVDGTLGTDRFLNYYNAETGKEEKIRRVDRNGNEVI